MSMQQREQSMQQREREQQLADQQYKYSMASLDASFHYNAKVKVDPWGTYKYVQACAYICVCSLYPLLTSNRSTSNEYNQTINECRSILSARRSSAGELGHCAARGDQH